MDIKPAVIDKAKAKPLTAEKGEIEFKRVTFGYDQDRIILNNVNFSVPAGKTVAIVGPSGGGKSTISRLLFRFYDVNEGGIFIDKQSLKEVSQDSVRKIIGIVPQDTVLFNDTIEYNIRYGRLDATKEEVKKVVKLAQLEKFIGRLPKGYETLVGERGLKLSGGEKQRVAIARMLLKEPVIMLFDEATSALDSHTEKEIHRAIQTVSAGHTTMIIAHRLSTVVDADEILVLRDGQIVESGTHQDLLDKKGEYAEMWKKQQQFRQYRDELQDSL